MSFCAFLVRHDVSVWQAVTNKAQKPFQRALAHHSTAYIFRGQRFIIRSVHDKA